MDTSSSPEMRYIKDQPPVDYLELTSEGKFQLLKDAVESLDKRGILGDLVGNRTITSSYKNIDEMLAEGTKTYSHELSYRRLLCVCSRSWESGTDYFFLTLDKHWYWVRASRDSILKASQFVSMQELQWRLADAVAEKSDEGDDIFHQLLEALASLVGEEYRTRQARADRFGNAAKELDTWADRSEWLKHGR